MQENKFLQPRVSPKQKIALVLFGLFLFFVLLEAGLRLGGFILTSIQEHLNLQAIKQKGTYRILCLGESTTERHYPRFLEQSLKQSNIGVRFSVIDKGKGGTNTSAILGQVESYLNEYHPDMVVTMMGINDWGGHVPFEAVITSKGILLIRSFRIYKLTRLLGLHILAKAKEIGFYKPNEDRRSFKKVPILSKEFELKEAYVDSIPPKDALKKAIELNLENDKAYIELGRLYQEQGKFSQAEDALKKAIELNPKSDLIYGAMSSLYEEIGKPELAKEYAEKANRSRLGYYRLVTVDSYRKLKEILDKRGIRLVCVQYPMRNVEPLKQVFEQDKGIIFIDNESVFKEVLKKASYKDYFIDMFGGDFGHCTEKGNRLLAQNIADVILREVFNK